MSGGQTGADRAAFDFATEHGIPHGGWCPKGRRAADGPIDGQYQLKETGGIFSRSRLLIVTKLLGEDLNPLSPDVYPPHRVF